MKIAIYGFGNFGQFLASRFLLRGHTVFAASRSDYSEKAAKMGVHYFEKVELLAQENPDVLILAVSIPSFKETIATVPLTLFQNSLIVDVLSVKSFPKSTLLEIKDLSADILCTHPMFGPESGKGSWEGLAFMYEKVRIQQRMEVCEQFLSLFEKEGCRMEEMTCEEHDRQAASSQFITHTTGRMLKELNPQQTSISTKGFRVLLDLVDNTCKDSFDLYYGLYKYNPNARKELDALQSALQILKDKLDNYEKPQEASPTDLYDNSLLNPRVVQMNESKTVAVTSRAIQLQKEGKEIVTLSVGEPDIQPSTEVVEATVEAARSGKIKYTQLQGLQELRAEIAAKLRRENNLSYSAEEILLSSGAKQSITQAVLALCRPGDQVLIPAPFWVSYPDIAILAGAEPVILPTSAESQYQPDAAKLESLITNRTRILILCTPSNPTGTVLTRSTLESIAEVLRRHPQVLILSDEIYEHLIFDGEEHVSFASLPDMFDRTLTVNGFSKSYCMTGYRLGYLAGPLRMIKAVAKVQSQINTCAPAISQYAALAALRQGLSGRDDAHRVLSFSVGLPNEVRVVKLRCLLTFFRS
eukprot:TRINITY_DN1614_c0_g1_i1.p1 TRINITY_DN1614_c0_g1~~TRINITY_DN1614_c0_g1_i1.p1  ORF type:complete len:584 (+),score=123.88 TRINITY_DN1614_c0_g1_i1:74-1825(+)